MTIVSSSDESYRTLTEALDIGIFELDDKLNLIYSNESCRRVLGLSVKRAMSEFWANSIVESFREDVLKGLAETIDDPDAYKYEAEFMTRRRKDTIWVRMKFNTIIMDDGFKYIGTFQNVTSEKEAKEKIIEIQKKKDEFLATVSHEIRTPMNGILGMSNILSESVLTEEQNECCVAIGECANSLMVIINDILDFSKIEAGKMTIENIDFDIIHLLNDLERIFNYRLIDKDVNLKFETDKEISKWIKGDPGRLRQVLNNLIGNAVKFTSSGFIGIRVEVISEVAGYQKIKFSVSDTGIGIPKEKCDLIFQPFTQVDQSHTRKFGGTGLGLVITKKIIELQHGDIGFFSTEGKGTTFHFELNYEIAESPGIENLQLQQDLLKSNLVLLTRNGSTMENVKSIKHLCQSLVIFDDVEDMNKKMTIKLSELDFILMEHAPPEYSALDDGEILFKSEYVGDARVLLLCSSGLRGEATVAEMLGFSAYLTEPFEDKLYKEACIYLLDKEKGKFITRYDLEEEGWPFNRVLLVEDNKINQKIACKMLERNKLDFDVANDGLEALEKIHKMHYDLILMDMQMPRMNGLECTAAIRQLEKNEKGKKPAIIIALTANAMQGDRERCIDAGMNDYLSKPIKKDMFVEQLGKWSTEV